MSAAIQSPERLIAIIQRIVADFFVFTVAQMISGDRHARIMDAKRIAITLCRELTPASTTRIGRFFGGLKHAAVIYNCQRARELAEVDYTFGVQLATLRQKARAAVSLAT